MPSYATTATAGTASTLSLRRKNLPSSIRLQEKRRPTGKYSTLHRDEIISQASKILQRVMPSLDIYKDIDIFVF
jgi:hypothetical protein